MYMHTCHTCVEGLRISEDGPRCCFLFSTLSEAGSAAQVRSACCEEFALHSLSHRTAGITDANTTVPSFSWVLRIQARVLMFVQ